MNNFGNYLPDITIFNVVLLLLSILSLVGFILNVVPAYRAISLKQGNVIYTVVGWIGSAFFCCLLGHTAYSNTRREHWQRVGTPRYTVATVARTFFSRSGRKFNFTYQVGSYRGQDQGECGESCPALTSRRYVRFAAEAPDVCELTQVGVPDSVRHIPPLGWAKLP